MPFRGTTAGVVLVARVVLFLVLSGVVLIPAAASAHASFVRGTPGPGDVLTTMPTQVDAYFAQNIRTLSGQETYALWVTDANGNQVDNNDNTLDPNNPRHMTVTLQNGLADGVYTVHWFTVSDEDGDSDSGQYTFTIQV
jgi:methionine-rich copper-binding protein CopC